MMPPRRLATPISVVIASSGQSRARFSRWVAKTSTLPRHHHHFFSTTDQTLWWGMETPWTRWKEHISKTLWWPNSTRYLHHFQTRHRTTTSRKTVLVSIESNYRYHQPIKPQNDGCKRIVMQCASPFITCTRTSISPMVQSGGRRQPETNAS